MRVKCFIAILVLMAVGLLPAPAHADGVVTVCDEAHLLAALASGGTVTFACSGTITLSNTIVIAADTTIDGSGQNVTISGNNVVRVLMVNSGVTLNLSSLTVADGRAVYGSSGGGVYNQGTLNVTNSVLNNNRVFSARGGGVYNEGTMAVRNTTFSSNFAEGTGGGIENRYALSAIDSTFSANSATGAGGGISNGNGGTLIVSKSTFSANRATASDGRGGGIFNGDYYTGNSTLNVSNSTFFSNSADVGGGIFNLNGPATVTNSTFSGNSADSGGGIFKSPGYVINLANTIIANSPLGGNCFGTITDGGGNLSYPDTSCPGINADPLLGPLQGNGGPTWTMALGPGSAAIDAGVDATCAADPVDNRDQRGVVRPQGVHCDSGAFERPVKWLPIMLVQ